MSEIIYEAMVFGALTVIAVMLVFVGKESQEQNSQFEYELEAEKERRYYGY